jgi:hypothetical protein
MANEFIIKNGFRSQGNSEITGSLSVSGSISTISPVNLSGFADGSVLFTSGSGGAITGSSNLFWDNTTNRLRVSGPILAGQNGFSSLSNGVSSYGAVGSNYYYDLGTNTARRWAADHVAQIDFGLGFKFRVAANSTAGSTISWSDLGYWSSTTGNLLVGTTTDAGYKFDVSGTARTTGQHTVGTLGFTGGGSTITSIGNSYINFYTRGFRGFDLYNGNATAEGQKVLIGNFVTYGVETSRYTAAMLVVESTTKGFLPPRTSATSNISSPGQGLITYVVTSSLEGLYYYNSGSYEGWTRTLNNSGSQAITGGSLTINKSGSTVLDIQGSQGQLFSIIDALSGSLMSVNDVSGLPILEVFSDDRVVMGTYGASALIVTGSNTIISGSLRGRVASLSIASNTASIDLSSNNFFTITLANGANTYINPTNIQPGQTVNVRVTQGSAGTGTVSFPSFVDQASGSLYTGSAVANAIDIVTMITFDSSIVYISSIRNMI